MEKVGFHKSKSLVAGYITAKANLQLVCRSVGWSVSSSSLSIFTFLAPAKSPECPSLSQYIGVQQISLLSWRLSVQAALRLPIEQLPFADVAEWVSFVSLLMTPPLFP